MDTGYKSLVVLDLLRSTTITFCQTMTQQGKLHVLFHMVLGIRALTKYHRLGSV